MLDTVAPYHQRAPEFFEKYMELDARQVHSRWWPGYLPDNRGIALDIGAGSGRDAAALAEEGFRVVAVEPAPALRQLGLLAHPHVHWVDDTLPHLHTVRKMNTTFDFILMSAVWMHIPLRHQDHTLFALSRLTHLGSVVVITLRHGPSPDDRPMYPIDADKFISNARVFGFYCTIKTSTKDILSRPENHPTPSWELLIFHRKKSYV